MRTSKAGHVAVATGCGLPAPELQAMGEGHPEESALAQLVARGTLTPRRRRLTPFAPVRRSGDSLSDAVGADRKDRF